MMTIVAIAMAIIMAIPTPTMYSSRSPVVAKFEGPEVADGAGVGEAAAATTVKPVAAVELP
jgi:hypothetical protein